MAIKVMICDDSATMRKLVTMALGKSGLEISEIIEAEDGKDGLAKAEANPDIGLIFLDWNMPNLNGMGFLQAYRFQNSSTPVIMITTEATDEKVNEAKQNGANGYITKPFTPDKIKAEVDKFIA